MLNKFKSDDLTSSQLSHDKSLYQLLKVIPPAIDCESAEEILIDLKKQSDSESPDLNQLVLKNTQIASFLTGVFSNSPYLKDLGMRDLNRLYYVLTTNPRQSLSKIVQDTETINSDNESELMHQLRVNKQYLALTTGLADLGGTLGTMEITRIISEFADASIKCCMQFCLADLEKRGRYTPTNLKNNLENSGWFALAMGKHGAFELNYSSDIDIIVFI